MGLDYGSRTVGVAVSDPMGITAQPAETIWREREDKLRRTLARLEELIREYEVDRLVLGLPKNMDNTLGERAQKVLEFREKLEHRTGLEVILWDERLTTKESQRLLSQAGIPGEKQKAFLDKMAAVLILQGFLDSDRRKTDGEASVQA